MTDDDGPAEPDVSAFVGSSLDGADVGSFLDDADVGFLLVDDTAAIVRSNERCRRLLDLGPEPAGTPVGDVDPLFGPDLLGVVETASGTGVLAESTVTLGRGDTLELRAVPVDDGVGLLVRDETERAETERELSRSTRILETLEDGVYTLDEAFVITAVNEAVSSMTGYDREELVGSHASLLAGPETISMADEILGQLRDDSADVGMIESSLRTATGESVPIETRFSPVEFDDGRSRYIGVVRDVSDRRRSDVALRELNRSARELLNAADERAVYRTIADVAASVWPDATVAAYSFDRSESVLDPVGSPADDREPRGPGTDEWEAFSTGEAGIDPTTAPADTGAKTSAAGGSEGSFRRVERAGDDAVPGGGDSPSGHVVERADGAASSSRTLYATLAEHGLIRLELADRGDAGTVEESVTLLASNAVAALERVEREAALSRHREALADRNRTLERLHGFNDLVRRIDASLVEADTLDEIAAAVCGPLVEADGVAFAWFGETYRTPGELRPVDRAGADEGYLDELLDAESPDEGSVADAEPSHRARSADGPVVVSDVADGLRDAPWRERALMRGYRSAVGVPVASGDLEYGVLSVYADERSAFDGEFGDLLGELGATVADAIEGVETERSLRSDGLVEVGLRIDDPGGPLSRTAAALGESIRVEGTVAQSDDRSLVYFATDGDPDGLPAAVRAVESVRRVDESPDGRIEASVAAPTVVDALVAHGGSVERLVADADGVDLTVALARSTDVRSVVESLRDRYGSVALRSRRDSGVDGPGSATGFADRLTDRQREAARTAYLGGYFAWPRASTGEEVAAAMGITQPTFNRHLRTVERKLFSSLFDGSDPDD